MRDSQRSVYLRAAMVNRTLWPSVFTHGLPLPMNRTRLLFLTYL